jgi:outer membrane protein OmpA-like peptidoglycan-associated protein
MSFKLKFCAASLLALAVFSGAAQAEGESSLQPVTEQPVAAEPQPAAIPDGILALLNDKRAASELSQDDLVQRFKSARKAVKMDGLPEDLRGQLQAMVDADKAEIDNRKAAAEQQAPAEKPKEQAPAAAEQQPAQEQPAAPQEQSAQPAPPAIPDAVSALLSDKRAAGELSEDDLRQRFKATRKAMKMEGVPDDARATLQALLDADKAEIETRKAAAEQQQKPVEAPKEQPPAAAETQPAAPAVEAPKQAEAPPAPAEMPADVLSLLADTRTADALSQEELMARMKSARRGAKDETLPADVRDKLQAMATEARTALMAREAQGGQPPAVPDASKQPEPAAPAIVTKETGSAAVAPPPPEPAQTDKTQVQALDGNTGDPAAEQKAKVFLDDATPAASLNDDALRARLDGMRDLLAENELSSVTERALRKKLRDEREVLRARVAEVKAKEEARAQAEAQAKADALAKQQAANPPPPPAPGQPVPPQRDQRQRKKFNFNIIITADMPRQEILRDRRPPDELQEEELRRRIEAYRDVQSEDRYLDYDPGVRDYWRQSMQRDRQILRQRMLAQRAQRAEEYRSEQARINLNDLAFADEQAPQDVFAAEVDDQQIEDVIVAPPRRKVQKRYAVKDFASNRQLRESVSHVEVDTIHFGFNEAFVREEEVGNLDQVASVMEKVLRKYPREVFLIEGHTDAVGSDAYNIKLSRARAEAVKKTLLTYYLIPGKNLATVGLGERYLKIPTADPEPENRRVSISRVTALVGQAPR